MIALIFSGLLGVSDFFGMGEKTDYFYYCSDPAFFITREAAAWSGDQSLVLKGVLNSPQPGYMYRMMFLGIDGPQAHVVIQTGQPIDPKGYGRGLPSVSKVEVHEKLPFLNESVGLLHVRIEGLTQQPWEFTCDITKGEMQE